MRNVLEIPIEDLDLTVRSFDHIRSLDRNIKTAQDLIKYTKEDLANHGSISSRYLKEIIESLNFVGLNLKKKFTIDDNIENFNFSTRVRKALISNQLSTPRDILSNKEVLLNINQLGQKSFSEIDIVLESLGIESDLSTFYQKRIKNQKLKV